MIVRGELKDSDVYRLHKVVEPAIVIIRSASATCAGLRRLKSTARLMRRHQFIFVLRRTLMRPKRLARVLHCVRRMKNVFFGVIEDEKNPKNIQRRRQRIYDRLVRDARASASKLAVQEKE